MPDPGETSLAVALGLFAAAAVAILLVGTRLTAVADALADRTGLGEAVVGAVLLGAATSLSGIVASVTAAADGRAELAVSNAVGGIAAQTVFLVVADVAYRRANLEHAAASPANLTQGALLVTLLAIPLLALSGPNVSFFGVHPATPLLVTGYLFGLRVISKAQTEPMWGATKTAETQNEEEEKSENEDADEGSLAGLWVRFALFALAIEAAGWVVARTGANIAGTALGLLSEGAALGIFPEGTRQRTDARRGASRSGVGMLAARSGALVLPVYVDRVPGLAARLRGERLWVYVGEPLRFDELDERRRRDGTAYRRIAGEILRAIYALKEEHAAREAGKS